ncbi:hypothetical protein LTR95_000182 [Oleoguttula sp. CCFEE 5521]
MPPIPGMVHWHSLIARHAKNLKAAFQKVAKALDAELAPKAQAQLEPILVRNSKYHPTHPLARIRQSQSRWYSTSRGSLDATIRHFSLSASRSGIKYDRAPFPKSRVSTIIGRSNGRSPFNSTLRPNLTGGALGRTAGGYSVGSGRVGGARFFSHGPASQAQVVQNVSQAVRAFFISGNKAQFDGTSRITGGKRYKAVTSLQAETGKKMRSVPKATPGSWVDFPVNPTITALTPLAGLTGFKSTSCASIDHLNTEGLLDVLSVDFSRVLKDLAAVLNDLKRLSALGDLPITYQDSGIRVHFPGVDAGSVERLCEELNVTRGVVTQDEAFDSFAGTEIALLFPFAPSAKVSECASFFEEPIYNKKGPLIQLEDMLFTPSESHEAYSTHSDSGLEDVIAEDDFLYSPSGYESVRSGSHSMSDKHSPLEYHEFEGIYRFIEQCDRARR